MAAFLIILLLVAAALEIASLRDPLSRVRYSARTSSRSVDPDERFAITSTIENGSYLPITYLRVQENLPQEAEVIPAPRYEIRKGADGARGSLRLVSSVYILPRRKLVREITASLPRRGRYFLRSAELFGGDFLGFSEAMRSYQCFSEIVVLPRRAEEAPELSALGGFLGDVSVRRFIMEDPVLTLGFRDYTGREPQKQISWLQSARAGKLMVKEFDHTLESAVTVLLIVEGAEENAAALIERCYSLARTVCETLEARRIKYNFLTNATAAGAIGCWSAIAEGLGESHLFAILEGLGRATYEPYESTARLFARAAKSAEQGRSHIVIAPRASAPLDGLVRALSARVGSEALVVRASAFANDGREASK